MIELPLFFLGTRNYVNGLTLFEETIKAFLDHNEYNLNQLSKIRSFKINRFVRNSGHLKIVRSLDNVSNDLKDAAARMDLVVDKMLYTLLFFENMNKSAEGRVENYDRSIYIKEEIVTEDGSWIIKLNNVDNLFSFMRGVVEANFRYCVAQAASQGIYSGVSWAYLYNFDLPRDGDLTDIDEIKFRHTSTIQAYDKIFVIREISSQKEHISLDAEICFFFDKSSSSVQG